MRVAYDLDDTIIIPILSRKWRKILGDNLYFWLRKRWYRVNPNIDKKKVQIILTARNVKDEDLTINTCRKIGLNTGCYIFNPEENWDKEYIIAWKRRAMKNLEIDKYVDVDEEICKRVNGGD